MKRYINYSKALGENSAYVQGRGGNTSIKKGSLMYVKSSGFLLKDLAEDAGIVGCLYRNIASFFDSRNTLQNDTTLNTVVNESVFQNNQFTPSIETGLHAVIPSRYVFHTHSVYANVFNAITSPERYLKKLLGDISYIVIPYKNPGYQLASYIYKLQKKKKLEEVLFLQNHGLVVHGQNLARIVAIHRRVNDLLNRFIIDQTGTQFRVTDMYKRLTNHFFPDSVVYSSITRKHLTPANQKEFYEIVSANTFITDVLSALGENPQYIPKREIVYIQNMDREKHRIKLITK